MNALLPMSPPPFLLTCTHLVPTRTSSDLSHYLT
jgi:hypothetical protein